MAKKYNDCKMFWSVIFVIIIIIAFILLVCLNWKQSDKKSETNKTENNLTVIEVCDESQAVTLEQVKELIEDANKKEDIVISEAVKELEENDLGRYDYCIEWDGWIRLENMVYNCYSFIYKKVLCDWKVQEDNSLLVVKADASQTVYNCSRLAKTIKI